MDLYHAHSYWRVRNLLATATVDNFTTVNGYAYQRASFNVRLSAVPAIIRATLESWRVMFGRGVAHWRGGNFSRRGGDVGGRLRMARAGN